MQHETQRLRPDSKGRISLGKLAHGVSSFHVRRRRDGSILLEPFAEIPAHEKWLFDNPDALNAVKNGLNQAKGGDTQSLGSFAHYADDDIE